MYFFAWVTQPAKKVVHTDRAIVYIGETSNFCDRMGRWATSAGFWGERQDGHSAAWRWTEGSKHLWVAFFELEPPESKRMAKHVRLYYEIMATEEYRVARGRLPRVNEWEAVEDV